MVKPPEKNNSDGSARSALWTEDREETALIRGRKIWQQEKKKIGTRTIGSAR